ncbi:hypothetical protein [Sphaerotilus mobilis]|nr:hypothetical protein [Sphaerotilus mobilis]
MPVPVPVLAQALVRAQVPVLAQEPARAWEPEQVQATVLAQA